MDKGIEEEEEVHRAGVRGRLVGQCRRGPLETGLEGCGSIWAG